MSRGQMFVTDLRRLVRRKRKRKKSTVRAILGRIVMVAGLADTKGSSAISEQTSFEKFRKTLAESVLILGGQGFDCICQRTLPPGQCASGFGEFK